jgi:hypothetical protein
MKTSYGYVFAETLRDGTEEIFIGYTCRMPGGCARGRGDDRIRYEESDRRRHL